jgi:hypothetical protein
LEKISFEHLTACLLAGVLMAVLLDLDFFSTGVQVSIGDGCNNWGFVD